MHLTFERLKIFKKEDHHRKAREKFFNFAQSCNIQFCTVQKLDWKNQSKKWHFSGPKFSQIEKFLIFRPALTFELFRIEQSMTDLFCSVFWALSNGVLHFKKCSWHQKLLNFFWNFSKFLELTHVAIRNDSHWIRAEKWIRQRVLTIRTGCQGGPHCRLEAPTHG